MSSYIKTNMIPIIIEMIFIISCFVIPKEYFVNTDSPPSSTEYF